MLRIPSKKTKRNPVFVRRYTFKLYPNASQKSALERQCVLLARLWNAALEEREYRWRRELLKPKSERRGVTFYDQSKAIKIVRADDPEYAAMSSDSMSRCLEALDLSFRAFWRRLKEGKVGSEAGYPRYKRLRGHATIWHRSRSANQDPLSGRGWKLSPYGNNWKLYAKGIPGRITARGKFPGTPKEFKTMEIMRRDGCWWLSIVAVMPKRLRIVEDAPHTQVKFGLLDEFATLKLVIGGPAACPEVVFKMIEGRISVSNQKDAEVLPEADPDLGTDRGKARLSSSPIGPDATYDSRNGVEAIQRRMARCKIGSNRYRRLKQKKSAIQSKVARRRRESLHNWTTLVVRHLARLDVFKPGSMKDTTRSGRGNQNNWGAAVEDKALFNRHLLEQAPSQAVTMLAYKAEEAGIEYSKIEHDDLAVGNMLVATKRLVRRANTVAKKGEV